MPWLDENLSCTASDDVEHCIFAKITCLPLGHHHQRPGSRCRRIFEPEHLCSSRVRQRCWCQLRGDSASAAGLQLPSNACHNPQNSASTTTGTKTNNIDIPRHGYPHPRIINSSSLSPRISSCKQARIRWLLPYRNKVDLQPGATIPLTSVNSIRQLSIHGDMVPCFYCWIWLLTPTRPIVQLLWPGWTMAL